MNDRFTDEQFYDRDITPGIDAARLKPLTDAEFCAAMDRLEHPTSMYKGFDLGGFAMQYEKQHDELVAKYGSDFANPCGMPFGLNKAEAAVISEWTASLRAEIMAIQNKGSQTSGIDVNITGDEPYYGACGGGLSYTFTPTSLGTIVTVKEAITGKELNVSDALGWYFYG